MSEFEHKVSLKNDWNKYSYRLCLPQTTLRLVMRFDFAAYFGQCCLIVGSYSNSEFGIHSNAGLYFLCKENCFSFVFKSIGLDLTFIICSHEGLMLDYLRSHDLFLLSYGFHLMFD